MYNIVTRSLGLGGYGGTGKYIRSRIEESREGQGHLPSILEPVTRERERFRGIRRLQPSFL